MPATLADSLEIASFTDPGRVRSRNEDALYADAGLGLAIVADGMGGYNAGEIASDLATTVLRTELSRAIADAQAFGAAGWAQEAVGDAIGRANAAIFEAAQRDARCQGMGTTVVLTLFHDGVVTVAHVGDSRLYRWRGGEFACLTRDHSLLQEQIDRGTMTPEEARSSRNRNLVTRALGVDPVVEADIGDHPVQAGDLYLLCSDGLNDMLEDAEIAACLAARAGEPGEYARRLVEMANEKGGRDNVSVVLVRVKKVPSAARGWWARLLAWFKQRQG